MVFKGYRNLFFSVNHCVLFARFWDVPNCDTVLLQKIGHKRFLGGARKPREALLTFATEAFQEIAKPELQQRENEARSKFTNNQGHTTVHQHHPDSNAAEAVVVYLAAYMSTLTVLVCLHYLCLTVLPCDKCVNH